MIDTSRHRDIFRAWRELTYERVLLSRQLPLMRPDDSAIARHVIGRLQEETRRLEDEALSAKWDR